MAWLVSSFLALASTMKTSFQSFFSKPEQLPPPQPPPPSSPPPQSTLDSTFIQESQYSNPQLPTVSSPTTPYPRFIHTRPLNPTISAQAHVIIDTSTVESARMSAQSEGSPVCILPNTNTHTPAQSTQPQMLNPIVQLFRDQDLGKTALTFVVPITTVILSDYISPPTKGSPPPLPLTLPSICLGLCALWNGILLRSKFPNASIFVEQLGAAAIFFAFYSVVSSVLPQKFVWVPWACFASSLLTFVLSFLPIRDKSQNPVIPY